ncbi:MAG: cytochrome c peroxidase [Myxococcota bacterium]|nr:cytochrome c peroxidase [Myxococcota bacterium]
MKLNHRWRVYSLFSLILTLLLPLFAQSEGVDVSAYRGFFKALPATVPHSTGTATEAQVKLGRMLYYEKRLSKSGQISCNSCHQLNRYGVDGEPTSPGHNGVRGGRNSPTVYNAAGHISQFWDGRAADVEEQAKGPVLNPIEMAMPDAATVEQLLRSIPGYVSAFKAAFPSEGQPVTYDNFARAVGAFERGLMTTGRFDKWISGDESALSATEREGLQLFVMKGCSSCHSGAYLGGHMYQKLGVVSAWPNQKDQGRFDVTQQESDRMMFKVPSLRNVAETGPYFHDGQTQSLSEAVQMMAKHQLGQNLSSAETGKIVAFLKALTGTVDANYIKEPALP